jgi:hypothetical protein
MSRFLWHVIRREIRGFAVLPDVSAEEREIAAVARPCPVIYLPSEIPDGTARSVYETHIPDLQVLDELILGVSEK